MAPVHAKCGRELAKVRGEWYCLKCWTSVELPVLTPEEAAAETGVPEGRTRRRTAGVTNLPWTATERAAWETWKEGDPVPGEDRRMEPDGLKTLDTRQLGASCIESLRYLAEQRALVEAKLARITEEAAKLVSVAQLCGANVPAELAALGKGRAAPAVKKHAGPTIGEFPCEICGAVAKSAQGRGAHKRFNHGIDAA